MAEVGWLVVAAFGAAGATCGAAIRVLLRRVPRGARLPAGSCELPLAALWAAAGWVWLGGAAPTGLLPLLLGLGVLGAAAGPVDVRHHRLPDALTLPAVPIVLALLVPLGPAALARGVAGMVLAVLVYGLVHLIGPAALGAGDVKLAGSLGAATAGAGWAQAMLAVAAAGVLSALAAVLTRREEVPHGPAMLIAAVAAVAGPGIAGASATAG